MNDFIDRIYLWIAYRIPRRLAMWVFVRVGAAATKGTSQVVSELTVLEALNRWENGGDLTNRIILKTIRDDQPTP